MDQVPDATVSMSALYAQTLLGIVRFGHPRPLVQGLVLDCCAIYPKCCMRYHTQFESQVEKHRRRPLVLINRSGLSLSLTGLKPVMYARASWGIETLRHMEVD